MKIKITANERNYFDKLLLILSCIPPFNKVSPRDLELYAKLLKLNYQHSRGDFQGRQLNIFDKNNKKEIADEMGINVRAIYSMLTRLKEAGIIKDNSLIPKYVLPKTSELTFVFEEEEE